MYNDELIESSKIKWQSFLKGDDDAYAWLYSRYVQQLYQYGCRFTTDTEMVKDCVQDVFVNVYRQKDRYSSPPDNVKIYLMSSLRNSIFNVFNKGNLHDTYISNINYEFDLSVEEKLMFIFSAKSLGQTYRRLRYVREYATYQRLQGEEILKKQEQIKKKRAELQQVKKAKENLLKDREPE